MPEPKPGPNGVSANPEMRQGDILRAVDVDAVVNPVNCVGVMGKGLALQFARRYPEIVAPYRSACRAGELTVDHPQILRLARSARPLYVVNLATKQHWRNPSQLEWIDCGLADMYRQLESMSIESVAIPPLGSGLGGLPWRSVQEMILKHAEQHPRVRTVICYQ